MYRNITANAEGNGENVGPAYKTITEAVEAAVDVVITTARVITVADATGRSVATVAGTPFGVQVREVA